MNFLKRFFIVVLCMIVTSIHCAGLKSLLEHRQARRGVLVAGAVVGGIVCARLVYSKIKDAWALSEKTKTQIVSEAPKLAGELAITIRQYNEETDFQYLKRYQQQPEFPAWNPGYTLKLKQESSLPGWHTAVLCRGNQILGHIHYGFSCKRSSCAAAICEHNSYTEIVPMPMFMNGADSALYSEQLKAHARQHLKSLAAITE